jgi:hypothetical protein
MSLEELLATFLKEKTFLCNLSPKQLGRINKLSIPTKESLVRGIPVRLESNQQTIHTFLLLGRLEQPQALFA